MPPEEWASLHHPTELSPRDPNKAPTELASTPLIEEGEAPSIPETPRIIPDHGAHSPEEAAGGSATRIEGKDVLTQTPPPFDSGLP